MKRILIALVLGVIFAPAYSSNITVVAQGVFSEYTDPDGLLPFSEPAPGTIFTIKFTYDSTTPDVLNPIPGIAFYEGAISDMSLTIADDVLGIRVRKFIFILDDSVATTGDNIDFWEANTSTLTPTGTPNMLREEGFGLGLTTLLPSTPVPPLSSDSLVTPSWPSGWDTGEILYSIRLLTQDGSGSPELLASAAANITSITVIPLPAAVWLFGTALGLLGWIRKAA